MQNSDFRLHNIKLNKHIYKENNEINFKGNLQTPHFYKRPFYWKNIDFFQKPALIVICKYFGFNYSRLHNFEMGINYGESHLLFLNCNKNETNLNGCIVERKKLDELLQFFYSIYYLKKFFFNLFKFTGNYFLYL